jgi:lysophospholipase L1-like esterase
MGMQGVGGAPSADPPAGGVKATTNPSTDPPTDKPTNPQLPTLWVIGDSTVRNGNGKGGNGQWGWGDPLKELFDREKINVINRAIGGRSSRTFITEGRWDAVLAEAKAGDYVIMQFGHNDSIAPDNKDRPRGTIRGVGEETVDIIHPQTGKPEKVFTFGHYMRKYVQDAKAKGMTPIVCSYIPRCPAAGKPVTPATRPSSYQLWAQEVAEAEKVPYIDLFSMILEGYSKMASAEEVKEKMFTKADNTHTSIEGARYNAAKVAEGIRANVPELAKYLK